MNNNVIYFIDRADKWWHFAYMNKKQDSRPQYSQVASIRLTQAEREMWIRYSDKLGLSGNRFFAKAITDYINMIDQPPGKPIKVPAFLAYCRTVMHGGDAFLHE